MNRALLILLSLNLCLTGAVLLKSGDQEKVEAASWPDIEEDSIVSYTYRAELVRVIDGDTVVLDIDLGFETWIRDQSIRLYGIDTPEITGEEKEEGLAVKSWLEERLYGQEIVLQSIQDKKGKFGRWLGVLFIDGKSVNDELLSSGKAQPLGE